jgi:hypothetical protein
VAADSREVEEIVLVEEDVVHLCALGKLVTAALDAAYLHEDGDCQEKEDFALHYNYN